MPVQRFYSAGATFGEPGTILLDGPLLDRRPTPFSNAPIFIPYAAVVEIRLNYPIDATKTFLALLAR